MDIWDIFEATSLEELDVVNLDTDGTEDYIDYNELEAEEELRFE